VERIENHSFLTEPLVFGAVVLDLGLNEGNFAVALAERFGCTVFGVEPVPMLFAALPRHPRLTVSQRAITGDGAPVELHLNESSCATITPSMATPGVTTVTVDSVTLAALMDEYGVDEAALVKVDIEGAEIAMFDEADDATLSRVGQFTVEFHDFLDPAQAHSVERVSDRLIDAGFRRVRFSRNNTDVLFVNPRLVSFGPFKQVSVRARYKYPRGVARVVARVTGSAPA